MAMKTVLTYADGAPSTDHRLAAAIETARQMDAHLTVLAFGFQPDIPPYVDGMAAGTLAMPPDTAQPDAEERARTAGESIARAGIRGEAVPVACPFGGFARALGDAAQFSDLVVLDRPYGRGAGGTAAAALEGALFDGDGAVLVFPDKIERLDFNAVLIAWNGSREALRAVRRAMPLLVTAQRVEVAIFGATPSEPMPGERLATMLSRHGIAVEVTAQVPSDEGVTASLRRRVVEAEAGLVVMGAYSHSRFREYVIGGVTKDYLADFATPVLMAH
jgi:nucleotide-binding universal stress UspA family protein